METFRIYLAGGMSGLSWEEQTAWRTKICNEMYDFCDNYDVDVEAIDPTDYYNFKEPKHKSEKEVRNFDLHKLRRSDLVIVNFNSPNSIGTAQELAVAYEHRIPVIGLNEKNCELHPWLVECCERIFDDIEDLIEYVQDFYLM